MIMINDNDEYDEQGRPLYRRGGSHRQPRYAGAQDVQPLPASLAEQGLTRLIFQLETSSMIPLY